MWVKWDPAPPGLSDCKALTDTDQIWAIEASSANVYYKSGWVGIGMDSDSMHAPTSTSVFDVKGDMKVTQPRDTCVAVLPTTCPAASLTPKTTARVNAEKFLYASDIRLKSEIETVTDPLQKVQDLRGVSFNWRESGNKDYGFIAQEVQRVLPEVIREDESHKLSVDYIKLVPIMVEAVRQQQQQIDSLKAEIRQLKQ
jgi:hypothetical protein